ncbi:hypothetical protein BC936DRAFT_149595 [Jimgerdemannia flammicorona]|uniref:Uncharacterized protein n=2 Tax=Jimgerdemannia flammicorona TaxID=994334 RepID=A0A433DJV0_9FUNG|nr:hypothetical protein BC936DRAFT_149595 [Jimgerdemannia flammicorona]RUS34389.1 hypothetical protein BC938DRAFT_480771 [Jimgerdemannia flammicorona]
MHILFPPFVPPADDPTSGIVDSLAFFLANGSDTCPPSLDSQESRRSPVAFPVLNIITRPSLLARIPEPESFNPMSPNTRGQAFPTTGRTAFDSLRAFPGIPRKSSRSLDITFLLETSDGMKDILKAFKSSVDDIFTTIHAYYPGVPFRTAFVGYRGTTDMHKLIVGDFVSGSSDFKRFLHYVHAYGGGGDYLPKDIFSGLDAVLKLDWQAGTRILVHVANAPCHGIRFHEGLYEADPYPYGDPDCRRPEDLLHEIWDNEIAYSFVKLTGGTDRMIREFDQIAQKWGTRIVVRSLDSFVNGILAAVVSCIAAAVKMQSF